MSAPLPRSLPGVLRWQQHLGGLLRQTAWLFVLVGAVVAQLLLPRADLGTHSYDRTSPGVVESVDVESVSKKRKSTYRVVASFADERGAGHRVRSYGTARSVVGGQVVVRYQASDPDEAVIDGLAPAPIGREVLLVLIFPAVGLLLLLSQLPESRRAVHLLRHGVVTEGVIVGRRAGKLKVNRKRNTVFSFEYAVEGGRTQRCEVSTFRPAALEDQGLEPMLYDPATPNRATTLDHLPGGPRLAPDGTITSEGGGRSAFILPALAVAASATAAVMTLVG